MRLQHYQKHLVDCLSEYLQTDFAEQEAQVEAQAESVILLCGLLLVDKSYLFLYGDNELKQEQLTLLDAALNRRLSGEPLAYILQCKAFWAHDFYVNENVLIPRADTECLVEAVLALPLAPRACVMDAGTGSGILAVSLAYERPHWQLYANDCSAAALSVAKRNAQLLLADSSKQPSQSLCSGPLFFQGDWLFAVAADVFDLVVANPPYIDRKDEYVASHALNEPDSALFSDNQGLADIEKIVLAALDSLKVDGWLVVEHGFQQGDVVRKLAANAADKNNQFCYQAIKTISDLAGRDRALVARKVSRN